MTAKLTAMLRPAVSRLRHEERGLTIVEGAVAGLMLVIGALAIMQLFDASTRNTYRAEESQVVVNRLQAEMEEIKDLPYAQVATTSAPPDSSDENDPRFRVSGAQYAIGRDGSDLEPMVIDAGGAVAPGPDPFSSGDVSGQIYRFVVGRNDPSCQESLCPGDQDLKRVIVAATIDDAPISFEHSYQELQTEVVDPDTTPVDNPLPPGEESEAVGEFWLTDTPCNNSIRQPITGNHLLHNTRGVCSAGMKTGAISGAPDLMFTEAPALDPNFPDDGQPLYDYATDVEPAQNPTQDKGLLLRRASINGCLLSGGLLDLPFDELTKPQKIHKWLSPTVPNGTNLAMLGHGTLELWTRTLNGASHPGKICIWLFVRETDADGVPVDTPVVNLDHPLQVGYFEYVDPTWPTTWTEISVPMHFASTDVLPGNRLGLAITVERQGTQPADGLEFLYDHPSFESRLQLDTDGILPF